MPSPTDATASEPQGILLYYKYVPLEGEHAEETARFYTDLCDRLDLRGRIRVARDGINVTVGGSMAALRAHAAAVVAHPLLRGGDIDFKLAPSGGSRNEATRAETKMDRLVVRLCEELVTLGPLARHRADPRVSTAPHLTPEQFHLMLQRAAAVVAPTAMEPEPATSAAPEPPSPVVAAAVEEVGVAAGAGGVTAAAGTSSGGAMEPEGAVVADGGDDSSVGHADGVNSYVGGGMSAADPRVPVVLLDARNIYETRIGHFDGGPSVSLLDPRTRCFSDLPAWMDAHEELLRNRTVLMYCTGGVRCERASAYLREKGPEFSRVFQLSGGIQRYLERFPDGGFFRGKNFLYDDRIAVGPGDVQPASPGAVVGRCLACGCAWDDYGARLRCSRCRLLVLVCDSCSTAHHHHHHHHHLLSQAKPPPLSQQLDEQAGGGRQWGPASAPTSASVGGKPAGLSDAAALEAPPPVHSPGSAADSSGRQLTHGSAPPLPLLCELCSAAVAAEDGCDGGSVANRQAGAAPTPAAPMDDSTAGVPASGGGGDGGAAADRSVPSFPSCVSGAAARSRALAAERSGPGPAAGAVSVAAEAPASVAASASAAAAPAAPAPAAGVEGPGLRSEADGPRRLRILCLHGFRQTAKQFQGRTCALRKKLRDLADFVFVDAPHLLPLFIKQHKAADVAADDDASCDVAVSGAGGGGADINAGGHEIEEFGGDGDGDGAEDERAVRRTAAAAAAAPFAAKRSWLLPPELYSCASAPADGLQEAPSYVDELQYIRQTAGWRESLEALRAAVRQQGPFDGVFGFSQGASVATVLCALQQQQRQHQQHQQQQQRVCPDASPGPPLPTPSTPTAAAAAAELAPSPSASTAAAAATILNGAGAAGDQDDLAECDFGFRFAVLASGFPSPLPEHRELMASVGPLELPSLHVYGSGGAGGGADRQICPRESEALAAAFSCGGGGARRSLCHQSGHLIPATRGHAATVRAFLTQFLPSTAP